MRLRDTIIRVVCSVLAASLLVIAGMQLDFINSQRKASEFSFPGIQNPHIFSIDCSSIALKYGLGTKAAPIINTTILGAVAKCTGLVTIESIMVSIKEKIPLHKEENAQAAKEIYNQIRI